MSESTGGASAPASAAPAATNTATTSNAPETIEQVIAQGDQKPATAQAEAIKQEIKAAKRKLQVKVHGQDREIDFDPSDEKAMKQYIEKALGADKVFEEGSLTKKQMNQLVDAIKNKDSIWDLMSQAGHNPDDLVTEYMERKIKDSEKSPEQIEFEKVKKELEHERQARKQMEEEKTKVEQQRVSDEYARNLNTEIEDAFKEMVDLPKSPYTVKRLAATVVAYMEKGVQINMKQAAEIVKKENTRELQEMFSLMPEEQIEALLGENNNKRLRARRVAKQKELKTASQIKTSGVDSIKKELDGKPQPKVSARDFFAKLSK